MQSKTVHLSQSHRNPRICCRITLMSIIRVLPRSCVTRSLHLSGTIGMIVCLRLERCHFEKLSRKPPRPVSYLFLAVFSQTMTSLRSFSHIMRYSDSRKKASLTSARRRITYSDISFFFKEESVHSLMIILSSYSLVEFSASIDSVYIHPLIHYWAHYAYRLIKGISFRGTL